MNRLYKAIALVVLLICLQAFPAMCRESWNIMTEELPPYNFEQGGEVHGISADILLEIMKKNGISIERKSIQLFPWPRAYRMTLKISGSILFSAARTAEREKLFKWVGPITDLNIGLTALKSRKIKLTSLADAARYRIGTIRDGAPEQLLLRAGVPEKGLDRIAGPELNIKKLQAGRIDMFAFNVPSTQYLMIKRGIDPDKYESVYTLKHADLYYAFNKNTDDRLIDALNRTLQEMKQHDAAGTSKVDRIIAGYLAR
jgi:ABC-type amino acid transport substrate-binding protein